MSETITKADLALCISRLDNFVGEVCRDLMAQVAERDAELANVRAEFERLQSRLDRALRACHIVTYGDGGITECADVVGELENSKRLDELNEESP